MVPDRTCSVQVCLDLIAQIFGPEESDIEDRQVENTQGFGRLRGFGGATERRRDP
jgi:hypothetical protein